MRNSWQIASVLLAADRKKGTPESGRLKAHPFILSFLNLFLCGYFDHLIKNDPEGHYITLFLFVEASLCLAFSAGYLFQGGKAVLAKSAVFPVKRLSIMLFTFIALIRRPLVLGLWLTSSAFILVFYYNRPGVALAANCIYSLLILNVAALASMIFLFSMRSGGALGAAGLTAAIVLIGVFTISTVFHNSSFLAYTPVVAWAGRGITEAQRGESAYVYHAGYLLCSLIAFIAGARKIC